MGPFFVEIAFVCVDRLTMPTAVPYRAGAVVRTRTNRAISRKASPTIGSVSYKPRP